MSIDARLKRVAPGLSAKERALLVLGSLKNKTPEDPSWRRTMPSGQIAEFNRLIVLMNACNIHLPMYITMVEQHTEQLWLRFAWWQTLVGLGLQTWQLAQLIPPGKHARAAAVTRQASLEAELPWEPEASEHSWLSLAERMEAGIRLMLVSLWQELRAIDLVLDEVAGEFEGEDSLRPVMRGLVEKTRAKLTSLHELLSATKPIELQEPDEEALDLARTYFDRGKQMMASL